MTPNHFFENYAPSELTDSHRILCTPGTFAKDTLFYIQEIGKLKSLKSHTSKRRLLDSYLFVIVISGEGTFTFKEKAYHAKLGDCFFINCMQPYSHRSIDSNPWELMWVHFNGVHMENYYSYFYKQRNSVFFQPVTISGYIDYLQKLTILAPQKNTNSELMVSHLLNGLITHILTDKNDETSDLKNIGLEKMEQIKNYLDESYQKKVSLDLIAEKFYISKYHMAREFKKWYGITILNYIIAKRITHAKGLLRFTDMHIEEIAQECGIDDNSYFNKLFRKIENTTASEYRKKWREN